MEGECAVCKTKSTKNCAICRQVFYCNADHQKQDWPHHRDTNCNAYRIKENTKYGRYLVANRDIKDKEIIFIEKPLVVGPKIAAHAYCLGCYKRLVPNQSNKYFHCKSCGWPVCNMQCARKPSHRDECEFIKSRIADSSVANKRVCEFVDSEKKDPLYCVIMLLRILLLRKSNPTAFAEFMKMESHYEIHKRGGTLLNRIYMEVGIPYLKRILHLEDDMHSLLKIFGRLDVNSFEIFNKHTKLRGLYPTAAICVHDCKPNTRHTFNQKDFSMTLYATGPIQRGEMISATYTQLLWGTLTRRKHLKESKFFECTCTRCSDNTEFGLFVGSIYCPICKKTAREKAPHMISTNPLNALAVWVCEKCSHEINGQQMTTTQEELRKTIQNLRKDDPMHLETFLLTYMDVLPPKSSIALDCKYALFQQYGSLNPIPGYELTQLSEACLKRKLELCQELLYVADRLEGPSSKFRATIMYDLQASLIQLAVRNKKLKKDEAINKAFEDITMKLKDAHDILVTEPELTDVITKNMKQLLLSLSQIGNPK